MDLGPHITARLRPTTQAACHATAMDSNPYRNFHFCFTKIVQNGATRLMTSADKSKLILIYGAYPSSAFNRVLMISTCMSSALTVAIKPEDTTSTADQAGLKLERG